jgi:signal transduction histidine kinase
MLVCDIDGQQRKARSMKGARSIRVRLSLVFVFFLLLVIAIGVESLRSLSNVNALSAQIRDRWLPSTRALGDLNNFTTDYPAAEAALLRGQGVEERAPIRRQIDILDREIAASERAYERIPHDKSENDLFALFDLRWATYRGFVARRAEQGVEGPDGRTGISLPPSADAYAKASAALEELTERNAASARRAGEQSDLAYQGVRRRILVTMVLTGLSAAGAMLYVQRSLSAPLVDLADRMHRLAASEIDLEVAGTARYDEIGDMARAVVVFRKNAAELADSRRALAEQALLLQQKLVEEREVAQLQRNFVSMVSHEFRTPLSIIDGQAQRLISLRDRMTGQQLAERAHTVRGAVHQMTQLIEDLIGFARVLDGPRDLHFQPRPVALAPILHEVCNLHRELVPGLYIAEHLDASLEVSGDARLLRQLFDNLLSNAAKYSPSGGSVTVTASRHDEQIEIVVEDGGIGIPEGDQARIFERYYRGSNTAGVAGSGVGLYLVKTIVELHHGTIAMASRSGAGSRFTVRLPEPTSANALA